MIEVENFSGHLLGKFHVSLIPIPRVFLSEVEGRFGSPRVGGKGARETTSNAYEHVPQDEPYRTV